MEFRVSLSSHRRRKERCALSSSHAFCRLLYHHCQQKSLLYGVPSKVTPPPPTRLPSSVEHPGVAFRRLLEPIGLLHEYYEAFREAGIDAEVRFCFASTALNVHDFGRGAAYMLTCGSCANTHSHEDFYRFLPFTSLFGLFMMCRGKIRAKTSYAVMVSPFSSLSRVLSPSCWISYRRQGMSMNPVPMGMDMNAPAAIPSCVVRT